MPSLPPISAISILPVEEHARILDLLFEPSTSLHTLSLPTMISQTYTTYDELITAIGRQCSILAESKRTSDTQCLEAILSSHPRLGAQKVDSEMSKLEQKAMSEASNATAGTTVRDEVEKEKEAQVLKRLNEEYEAAFPGLRYVVFVNGRSRAVIFEDMKRRIQRGNIELERTEATKAMCDIASDRARTLLRGTA